MALEIVSAVAFAKSGAILGGGMNLIAFIVGNSSPPTSILTTILTGLAVAVGGGVVLFLLNWLREHLTAKWNRHAEAEVLAFSLAAELDALVSGCFEIVHDPQFEDPDTGIWEPTVSIPKISFGENLKWSSFPKSLHYRIRALPNKIDAAAKSCAAEAEYGDGPPDYSDYFRERELRFAWIGLEASALRSELTKKYGVDYLDRGSWEPEESFQRAIQKIEKRKEEMAKRPKHPLLWPKVPMEELERRRADLGAALEAANARTRGGRA